LFRNLIKSLLVLSNYLDHMEDRRDLTLDEQVFASGYKHAIMCYRILWFFNFAIERLQPARSPHQLPVAPAQMRPVARQLHH